MEPKRKPVSKSLLVAHRPREQMYGRGAGGEVGEDEMYDESNMETYITICKIDSQWEFVVKHRELKLGLYNNLER